MATRKKRNPVKRAHKNGLIQGARGRSQDTCPYSQDNYKAAWLAGWREGWDAYMNGAFSE